MKKVLPFNSKKPGETTAGGALSGNKSQRMQNELQEQYERAIRDGTIVEATQSWATQPQGTHPPDPPPAQKKAAATTKPRDMNRKESANTMQQDLQHMYQDNIKAGYIVTATRGPSLTYVPVVVNKHAAAQMELQAMYLESLKQGSVPARPVALYHAHAPTVPRSPPPRVRPATCDVCPSDAIYSV